MGAIRSINIVVSGGKTNAVKDLKLEVFVNGSKTASKVSYEDFGVYEYHEDMEICDMAKEKRLSKDYVLQDGENYYIAIEELNIGNNVYDAIIYQSEGYTFINGTDIAPLEAYCMDSKYTNGKSESFRFIYTHNATSEEVTTVGAEETEVNTVGNEEVPTTDTVVVVDTTSQEPFKENNIYPILYGVIGVLLVVIIVLSIVIVKTKNNNK